ncbi:PilZ domain-containing protein [Erythrobacter insulae]|uniref:PilZ domain-containing protein n=1 Tax=Erythrobacter insulae TaxID=2584124 RepID=A0A547PBG5_9SPHN|nr:PilZ domain-containing protein [Erythrobacter insulae]TRD11483.1 PilZ domain-containing protein [Erythrobacter insulae]
MSQTETSNENAVYRRSAPRVKLAIDSVFMGMDGRQQITLLDLSESGARVAFSEPPKERAGFISWMEFETFGDVVWQEGLYVGLKFDRPISSEWLESTQARVTDADSYRHEMLLKEAMEWVGT